MLLGLSARIMVENLRLWKQAALENPASVLPIFLLVNVTIPTSSIVKANEMTQEHVYLPGGGITRLQSQH